MSPVTVRRGRGRPRRLIRHPRDGGQDPQPETDPFASLCAFTDQFFGEWVQAEGTAEVISLPEAMELLVDYYRKRDGSPVSIGLE